MSDPVKSVRLGKSLMTGERSLAKVAEDLWGVPGVAPVTNAADTAEANSSAALAAAPSAFPSFDQLWKTADDTVDWTDALIHETCPDGMTSPKLWSFFHENAKAVLSGDTQTYLAVMDKADPLGDLQPYAERIDAAADSSDALSASFQVLPRYMEGDESARQMYLCGMAVRIARDLLALLPVSTVTVTAVQGDETLMTVVFPRSDMQRVRFSFIDPVAFVQNLKV